MKKVFMCLIACILLSSLVFAQEPIELKIGILEKSHEVQPGEKVYFKVELKDKENLGRHDVSLEYEIKRGNDVIIFSKELKAIETQASFLQSMEIPENVQEGQYSIAVTVNDKESSSASFYVKKSKDKQINKQVYYWLAGLFALIFLVYIISKSKLFIKKLQIQARVSKIVKRKQLK